jgi:ABC-type transport system involved in multi-copper enzyme maturation permease subunit
MRELWLRQIRGVLGLELRKTLLGGRALLVYFLALAPVAVAGLALLISLFTGTPEGTSVQEATEGFAAFFFIMLRVTLYLGCVWTFMNLIRGEVMDRSLHYYFLSPIRRDVLAAGKFIAGWASTAILFSASTIATMVLFYMAHGIPAATEFLASSRGMGQMLTYVGITVLACLGYGAVFLAIGLFLRNPVIPGVIFWLWEWLSPYLPAVLKKLSVLFYLYSLLPVELPPSPFSVLAEPVPAWLSVPGFLIFTALVMLAAGLRIRRMEIAYASD